MQLSRTVAQAAQALEPAALVAMRLVRPGGSVALVGDPKQLPATVLSQAASARHLAQSLFERLQRVRHRLAESGRLFMSAEQDVLGSLHSPDRLVA